jgi:hypothetical protein
MGKNLHHHPAACDKRALADLSNRSLIVSVRNLRAGHYVPRQRPICS